MMVPAPSKDACAFYFTPLIPNHKDKTGESDMQQVWSYQLKKSGGWTFLLNHAQCNVELTFESDFESFQAPQLHQGYISAFVHP